ncbi:MAG: lipoyl protein ligase domain-containing protein [Microthrixaceae bacterium]
MPARRLVRVHDVVAPAVVLGSTQPDGLLDGPAIHAAGVEVARRRSGGGAVHLLPGAQVWVDVVVPAGDDLWDDDVGRATWWLGEAWARALGGPGAVGGSGAAREPGAVVHRDGVDDRAAARIACFAAVGPGEVVRAGAKVVGISQRRTRHLARFQCVAYLAWDPTVLTGVLAADAAATVADALRDRVAAVDGAVLDRLVAALPT